jgi:hypothetical protein
MREPKNPSGIQHSTPLEISFIDPDVKIVKATSSLKKKAGSGGFDPRSVAMAEKRLAEAKSMFPKIAASDIEVIGYALRQLEHATQTKQWLERIQWSAIELKSNGAMFQYPLVTAVASSLCTMLDQIQILTPKAQEVTELHLKTLILVLKEGPRTITEHDENGLIAGLKKAVRKVLQETAHRN